MIHEPATYHRHRFPAEIISHANWLYHVLSLSLRDVELILAERGIVVTHESMTHEFATYPRHRFPAEIISHAVWLYHVFSLSLRDVELILAERGIVASGITATGWLLRRFCRNSGATTGHAYTHNESQFDSA
jgi:transposase-like protein